MTRILKKINWKVFLVLIVAGLVGVVAILPYMADLLGSSIMRDAPASEIPLVLVVPLAIIQNGVILSVTIFIGMILSERIGLRMPLIEAWASGEHPVNPKAVVLPGILVGTAVGIALVTIEALLFLKHLPAAMLPLFEISLWKRLLAGVLYGGFTEELVTRLFLLSMVAWFLGKWWKTPEGIPTSGAFWTAIFLVAVLFGLGHLPATSAMTPITQLLVARALVLNGIAGVAFGYLYWKRGLEAAMLGHMSAHLVMQIPGVMLLKRML
ncbi:MAG TPA: CPBP family intramembrane glutamic endopeptidase [Pyrinomonadaceae bacterium]|nr:CPBP family intramembrane glutamic endopeptidase [Pyrinomonadaceae bacterium]